MPFGVRENPERYDKLDYDNDRAAKAIARAPIVVPAGAAVGCAARTSATALPLGPCARCARRTLRSPAAAGTTIKAATSTPANPTLATAADNGSWLRLGRLPQ
jgi:hypothetical protein